MEEILFTAQQFEPFTASWGVEVPIVPYVHNEINGFIIPLGWDDELSAKNITFETITIQL